MVYGDDVTWFMVMTSHGLCDDVTWFMVMTINLFSFDSTYRVTSQALSFVPVVAGMEIYLFIS